MVQKKILVVDDERDLCDILSFNLSAAGYLVETVFSAEEALEEIQQTPFDMILLDVMMPGMSGFELAEKLKSDEYTSDIPIIFLTAKDTENDTLQGFSLGADDYVTKPFSVREVMARVKAVLNRGANTKSREIVFDTLVIDSASKTVTIDEMPVTLTRTEYELLLLLLSNRGKVFSRQELLERVWSKDVIVTERTVDVNITRLRKKLNQYAACLVSRTGFGYSFEKHDEI